MSKFLPYEQGSVAWYNARLGIPTSSNFEKIVTPKGEKSKQSRKYLYRLIAERLIKESQDDQIGFVQWVDRGKAEEGNAAAMFEFTHERRLQPGRFVTTDDGRIGCSPDRLLDDKEAVEIKSPAPWTQIGYLLDGPGDNYRPQVQGQLYVGGFRAVHFYSYHPQMPPFLKVTVPDMGFQRILQSSLAWFLDELDKETERAKSLGAYVMSRQVETPADAAYEEEEPLRVIDPETARPMDDE